MTPTSAFTVLTILIGAACASVQTQLHSATQTSNKSEPPYSIQLAGPAGHIKLASPVGVTLTVTNVTDHELYWSSDIGQDSAYKGFRFLLTKDGHEVETTFFNRKLTGRQRSDDPQEVVHGSSVTLAHPPGKMFEIPIDLTRLYIITEPGLYVLLVSRYDEGSKTFVRSNALNLRIER